MVSGINENLTLKVAELITRIVMAADGEIIGTERAETVELTVRDIEKLLGKKVKIVNN